MKIVQIARQFTPSIGGIERVTLGLSQALLERGHRTSVVTLREVFSTGACEAASESIDGLPIYRLPHLGSRRYPIAPGVLAFAERADVLHVHAIDFFVDFLGASQPCHRVPIVVNTHGGIFHSRWLLPLKRLYFALATRVSLRRAAAVICDSEHDYRLFRAIVPPHKLHVIGNGVDVRPFAAIHKQISPGLMVGIGRLAPNKRIDRIIDLLPALAEQVPSARLVWIGPDQDDRRRSLLAHAAERGVAERVQFTGAIDDGEMGRWLSQAHVFVSPAEYEAFGVSSIEAMSSATVPVVTPVGIHPEIVDDGISGFICEFEGTSAVERLRTVLARPLDELAAIGARARGAAQRYSWSNVVQQYLDVYQAAIS